jgi:hypothetical protein
VLLQEETINSKLDGIEKKKEKQRQKWSRIHSFIIIHSIYINHEHNTLITFTTEIHNCTD